MVTATRDLARSRTRRRYFFAGIALLLTGFVFWGFAASYYLPLLKGTLELSPLLHFHGVVFTAWMLFFLSQALLMAGGKRRVHMTLGWAGAGLASVIVVLGVVVTLSVIAGGAAAGQSEETQRFVIWPLTDILLFAVLFGLAIGKRRRPETHKRLVILAMLAMMPPALVRLSFPYFGMNPWPATLVIAAVIVAGMVHDHYRHGRIHPAWWIGGVIVAGSLPLRVAVADTDLWIALTAPLVRLVS